MFMKYNFFDKKIVLIILTILMNYELSTQIKNHAYTADYITWCLMKKS